MNSPYFVKLFMLVLITLVLSACCDGLGENTISVDNTNPSTILDTTAPIITLNGSANISLVVGDTYTELNATAIDDIDGSLSVSITGVVGTSTATIYTLIYRATDTSGNESSTTRTVTVDPLTPLNDTGITWGGNYPSGNNVGCIGETVDEQDCSHGRDADVTLTKIGDGAVSFDFTKLDANGIPLANQTQDYATQPWTCVKDNHTGLVWEVKTADATRTHLHSRDDRFNWYNTNFSTNGGAVGFADENGNICTGYDSGDASTYCNTEAFVNRVNAGNGATELCGATDWRVPSLNELQSIAHLGKINPAMDENYFPNSKSSFYWSSSPNASDSLRALGVSFSNSDEGSKDRTQSNRVRLVRSAS